MFQFKVYLEINCGKIIKSWLFTQTLLWKYLKYGWIRLLAIQYGRVHAVDHAGWYIQLRKIHSFNFNEQKNGRKKTHFELFDNNRFLFSTWLVCDNKNNTSDNTIITIYIFFVLLFGY